MTAVNKLAIPDHVMSRQVGDETVILDLNSGTYFGLDPVGARMWQLLTEGRQPDEMVRTLLDEYDVEETRLRQDMEALVDELVSRGLVLRSDDSES
jgi:hypothetical protein